MTHTFRFTSIAACLLMSAATARSDNLAFPPAPTGPTQIAVAKPAAPQPLVTAPKPGNPTVTSPARPRPGTALVEPQLHVSRSGNPARPRVALTFDACMGKTDDRILSVLVSERVPATIFVTARWLRTNPQALAILKQNPDLFELENHGQNHIPAIEAPVSVYGIAAAGSSGAVAQEVSGGAMAIEAAGVGQPRWFRGSTAKYDAAAIQQIRAMGYKIAGYSLNGDGGSLLGAAVAERKISAAKDGDVVIAHINQPTHAAGDGVARAILALKKRGVEFVRLQDTEQNGNYDTTGNIASRVGQ